MSKAKRILSRHESLNKPKAIICDLDGCLVPSEERQHFIDSGDWDGFHNAGCEILPAEWCLDLVKGMMPTHKIIFLSARPSDFIEKTHAWLEKYFGPQSIIGNPEESWKLKLRDNDLEADEFKKEYYEDMIKDTYSISFTIEDHTKNVTMWRELGLICLQPNFVQY